MKGASIQPEAARGGFGSLPARLFAAALRDLRGGKSLAPLFTSVLAGATFCVAVFFSFRSAWLGTILLRPLPIWDQWAFVKHYFAYLDQAYSLKLLLINHNEHRILTSRLLFFADAIFFRMNNRILYLAIYLEMLAISVLMVGIASGFRRWGTLLFRSVCLLGILWSISQYENLSWAFQPQFPFVHLFAIVCLQCLALALDTRRIGWLALACLNSFLAAYSMASGLFVLVPAIALAVWMRRVDWRFAVFLLFSLGVVSFYFVGYTQLKYSHYNAGSVLAQAHYALIYLASAFRGSPPLVLPTGYLLLAGFLALALRLSWGALVARRPADRSLSVLGAAAAFVLIEAAVTAYGRVGLQTEIIPSRYATSSVIFIAALLGALWRIRDVWQDRRPEILAFVVLIAASFGANADRFSEEQWRDKIAYQDTIAFALLNDALTAAQADQLSPFPGVDEDLKRLATLELGPFNPKESYYRPPLNSLADLSLEDLPACRFETEDVSWKEGGAILAISGWASAPDGYQPADWLLAYDDSHRLVSFTRPELPRRELAGHWGVRDAGFGYQMFVRRFMDASRRSNLKLVALFDVNRYGGQRACAIPVPVEANTLALKWGPFGPEAAKTDPAKATVRLDGSAQPGGTALASLAEAPVPGDTVYGTWRASDADTGSVTMTLPAPQGTGEMLALPVMVGPSTSGLKVTVRVGSAEQTLSCFGLPGQSWQALTISADALSHAQGQPITITAKDEGTGWGQWLAVSRPYWVQR